MFDILFVHNNKTLILIGDLLLIYCFLSDFSFLFWFGQFDFC
jgi:hypothetical protein